MANFDDLIKSARLPENSAPICLRGDLAMRLEQLERDLVDAHDADAAGTSLADGGNARKVAEEIEALQAEMREHTHAFAFRALPTRKYRDLLEDHPPREDHKDDAIWGANTGTFPQAFALRAVTHPSVPLSTAAWLARKLPAQAGKRDCHAVMSRGTFARMAEPATTAALSFWA